ncbi:MAG: hypothetical protein AB7G23_19385 [Vicinamibacterales bacterium]
MRASSATRAAALVSCAIALAQAGCATPHTEPLELHPAPAAAEEPPPPPRWRLDLELRPAGEGPAELWVPLPQSDARQAIVSLLWEVPPPSDFRLEERGAERWLVARTDRLSLRVRFQRADRAPELDPKLRAELAPELGALRGRTPGEWVTAARQRGLTTRLAYGVRWSAEEGSAPTLCEWPEVQLPRGEWVAVDVERGEVGLPRALRLGSQPAEARRGDAHPRLLVRAQLRSGEGTPER